MDAYTARCLQVSTNVSDSMPLQRRRSEMMKRQNSSLDARPVAMRPTHGRSKTSIGGMWPVQTDMTTMQQPQYSASSTTPMSLQNYRFSPPSAVTPYGTPFQVPYLTPVTPYTPSDWSASAGIDSKQLQGLGMDFADSDFAINSTEASDDIIHLNNNDGWTMSGSDSSERRSSTSDSDVTEFTESTAAHSRQSSAAFDSMNDLDMRRSRSLHRHSRSLSRTPASRTASKRAHRRQLSCQPMPHTRNASACGFMPPLPQTPALPDNQADALAMNFDQQVNFSNAGFSDADLPMDGEFYTGFDNMVGLPMMSQAGSSQANRLMTPPSDGMFWENTMDGEVFAAPQQHEHQHHNGCCSVDDPEKPDLFESLREEASNPPEEDMHPEDPDMVPQEQEPRFEGDLYTPRWVRGQGNKREGYCGLCKPGRWLVLKNSAYWYDKSFTHGVSASTGQPFEGPRETRRMAGNPDVWEGLCGGCDDWIALISSKKKGTTWFRHAYKCHGKNKDGANKKSRQLSPPAQPLPYANMKPVPMTELPSHPMFHHQQADLYAMSTFPGMSSLELRDPTHFSDMVFQ